MKTPELTGAQRDVRDTAFRAELNALPRFMGGFTKEALAHQVEVGRLMRAVWIKFFPAMRVSFNALPELENV